MMIMLIGKVVVNIIAALDAAGGGCYEYDDDNNNHYITIKTIIPQLTLIGSHLD